HVVEPHRRDPEHLEGGRHRVGGELAAAGATARTRPVLDRAELLRVDLARVERADRLEHVLNREPAALVVAVEDRAAVEHHAREVEPRHGHDHRGDRLVTAGDPDEAVHEVPAHDQLDGVGDGLAADERGLHALGAHRDAVRDGDRIELDRGPAGRPDPLLHLLGHLPMVPVARGDLDPAVRHADQRPLEVVVGEADGLEERAGRGAIGAIEDGPALVAGVERHTLASFARFATRYVKRPRCTTSPRWSTTSRSSTRTPASRIARFVTHPARAMIVSPSWTTSSRWLSTVRCTVTRPRSGFEVSFLPMTLARRRIVSPILIGPLNFQRRPTNASVAYACVARVNRPAWIARPRRPWAIRSPKIDCFMNSASVWSTL